MSEFELAPELFELVAERFRALAEPTRLHILNALQEGEKTVSELVERTELRQANVSKHLQLLYGLGYLTRRKEGLYVYYGLSDDTVFALCDIVCSRLEQESQSRKELFLKQA
jgi:DNA-binding transcriptional ArsR family regulator